jgi:DNA invertase Pin-like site-specific DNA recombinase
LTNSKKDLQFSEKCGIIELLQASCPSELEETLNRQRNSKITLLYLRLSRDDPNANNESNSITNQRKIVSEYAEANGFTPYEIVVDDGYSGTSFDRPGWNALMEKVDADEVSTIIVKTHDRLGRNYLQTGLMREMFRERGIRYIVIGDGVDTANGEDDFTPFREIISEMFARDTSRKIKVVLHNKGRSGKHMTSAAVYGYKNRPRTRTSG